jgi:hypothetical protein
MCFSADVSLGTFISGIVFSVLCFSLGTAEAKIIGVFFGFVIFMQLIEYLLWKHQYCDQYNKNLTIAGMILNHLQPVVLFLAVILFNKNIPSNNLKIMTLAVIIYAIAIIPYSLQFDKFCTQKGKESNNHLVWKWNNMDRAEITYSIFLISMMVITFFGMPSHKVIHTLITLLTFIISAVIYGKQQVAGALWCFIAAFAPLAYFITQKISSRT